MINVSLHLSRVVFFYSRSNFGVTPCLPIHGSGNEGKKMGKYKQFKHTGPFRPALLRSATSQMEFLNQQLGTFPHRVSGLDPTFGARPARDFTLQPFSTLQHIQNILSLVKVHVQMATLRQSARRQCRADGQLTYRFPVTQARYG